MCTKMKHLFRINLCEFRYKFSHCALQKGKSKQCPIILLSVIKSQLAFTFPIATIKLITVRVKDIHPSIATN